MTKTKAQKYVGWSIAWAWLLILLACGGGTVVVSPGTSSSDAPGGANAPKEQPKEPSLSERVGQSVTHEGVEVSVENAEIAVVDLKSLGQASESQEDLLQIVVRIENLSDAKKLNYRGWGSNAAGININGATLRDEHGNIYKRIGFGFATEAVGSLPNGDSIYPEKAVTDRLVFEVPVGAANYLELALPGDAVGITNSTFKLALRVPGKTAPTEEPAEPAAAATVPPIDNPDRAKQPSPVVPPVTSASTESEPVAISETPSESPASKQKESAEPLRTFKDASGKFSVDARMTAYGGGKVTLERADGKTVRVEFSLLSEDDQSWILAEVERRKSR